MSDKPMTQDELDDIRRRLEVATPGPWAFEKEDGKVLLDYTPKEIRICETGCLGSIANRMVCDMNVDWRYTYKNENEPMANAEFIAHAPTDIARLLAEVERLNKVSRYLAARLSPLNVTRRKYIGATLEDGYGNGLFFTREEAIQSWIDEANREVSNAE